MKTITRSKTKIIVWLDKSNYLPNIVLNKKSLPQVYNIMHFGNKILIKEIMGQDISIKTTQYIARND